MKKFKPSAPIEITLEGGDTITVTDASITVSKKGKVEISGQLVQQPVEIPANERLESQKGRIRSTMYCSAQVRFLYKDRIRTAAITHTTMKAVRIINTDLGVTWLPLHILRWSPQASQFVVIDEDWEMDFTYDVKPGMDIYPYNMQAEELIEVVNSVPPVK